MSAYRYLWIYTVDLSGVGQVESAPVLVPFDNPPAGMGNSGIVALVTGHRLSGAFTTGKPRVWHTASAQDAENVVLNPAMTFTGTPPVARSNFLGAGGNPYSPITWEQLRVSFEPTNGGAGAWSVRIRVWCQVDVG